MSTYDVGKNRWRNTWRAELLTWLSPKDTAVGWSLVLGPYKRHICGKA